MIIYITGTSTGIGKALAEHCLNEGKTVIGMARRCTISHPNYEHVTIDLSDLNQVNSFDFHINLEDDIILVNNAGTIGSIRPMGQQIGEEIIALTNLNLIAPQILMNKFINKFHALDQNYQILNVSSGAGKYPIDAWAPYCASKAGLDLFSETIALELTARNHQNWHVFSVAPGVVDTPMQAEIRSANPNAFLNHQKFIDLKENKELFTPNFVAQHLYRIMMQPNDFKSVVFSIRDLI